MPSKPPRNPAAPASSEGDSEDGLITSEDLFGDLVDAPLSETHAHPKARGPIKVRVPEPGKPRVDEPEGPLADEFSVLLDAFGESRRAEPPAEAEPPPPPPAPQPEPAPPARAAAPAPTPPAPAADPQTRAVDITGGDFALELSGLAEEAFASAEQAPAPEPSPPSAPPAPRPREEGDYGPYHLLERVARGGMAEVFKAKRSGVEGFEKIVAVKRILPHLSDNREFVEMFVNEAKLVAGLTHPNIVQIFDLGALESSYFIAMEFVHGRDLRSIQQRAAERELRIPMDLSALVIGRVCLALEFAHRKKDEKGRPLRLVHRDISPQNILLSFEGDVKLTDFGIAKAAAKASTTDGGALRGKLLYMSPEQAWGRPLDHRSDIFSLGVVFYELLAGQKPFQASKEQGVLDTVRQCRIVPLGSVNPRVPDELQRIVARCLERDPDDRYQNAAELHRDVERVLHERQAPTSAELARFLELIFDQQERGEPLPHPDTGEHATQKHIEVDLDTNSAGDAQDLDRTAPGIPRERSELQKLLERLRWK